MSEEDLSDDYIERFLQPFEVTGSEECYRVRMEHLSRHFFKIDDFFEGYGERVRAELAEIGFHNYHEKGYLRDDDEVVVYVPLENHQEERVLVDDLTAVVLGKSHSHEEGSASVPVEITGTENYPFENIELYMPAHEAVEEELGRL